MDEGWTRWVLEQYEFNLTTMHNADIRAGKLREKFDAIILADQNPRAIVNGARAQNIRPEYRGGIGDEGVAALKEFVARGRHAGHARRGVATSRSSASACRSEPEGGPDARPALRAGHDPQASRSTRSHPIGYGMAAETLRLLQQQPVLQPHRRLLVAEADGRRALPEHRRRRVGLAEGRGADGRPRRGRLDRHEPGTRSCCSACARSTARRRTRRSRCCSTRCICRRPATRRGRRLSSRT